MPQFLVSWRLIGVETVEAESPEQARSMVEAMPGVSGSPGYSNIYCTDPRCTAVSGRQGPSGYISPLVNPSSCGSL